MKPVEIPVQWMESRMGQPYRCRFCGALLRLLFLHICV